MAKFSENEIRNFNEDWMLDERNGLPYGGASVQKFIKEKILEAINGMVGKFGAVTLEDGQIKFFDEDGGNQLAAVGLTGSTYMIDYETETPLSFYCLTSEESKIITILPSTREGSIGSMDTHDFPENYTWTLAVDNGTGFVNKASGECVNDMPFSVNIRPFVNVGNNKIRIYITGDESKQTRSVIFTCILTTLSLSVNHTWQTAWIEGKNYTINNINFAGAVAKTLHVRIDDDEQQHYTQQFAASVSYVTAQYAFDMTDKFPAITGVHKVDVWMSGGDVETPHYVYNLMCVKAGEETSAKLVCINNVPSEIVNYSSQDIFRYATYGATHATLDITGSDGETTYPIISGQALDVQAEVKNTYATRVDIETEALEGVAITCVIAVDGFEQRVIIPINNKNSFPAVTGAQFYMNAAGRNNSESATDRTKIFNVAPSATTTEYAAGMTNFAWAKDGWTVDDNNVKCLAVNAGSTVDVPGIRPLASLASGSALTLEWKMKTSNISDYDTPIMSLMSTDTYNENTTNGVIVMPTKVMVLTTTNRNHVQQSVNLVEDDELHIIVVFQPNYNGSGHNLCRIFVNGMPQCNFEYDGNASFGNGSLKIGQTSADMYLYMMRWYNGKAFEMSDVLVNYLNTLSEASGKSRIGIASDNDVINGNSISYDLCKKAGFNVMVIETATGLIPDLDHTTKFSNTKMSIEYADMPEKNFTITGAPLDGQGTTSMKYYRWNLRWKCDDNTTWTYPNANIAAMKKSGWFDGADVHPKVSKITAKKNVASSGQGHKMGATALYNDLYKHLTVGIKSDVPENARLAVYQYPVIGFVKNGDEYRFIGIYTVGPDKGDSGTFGYDKKAYPKFLSLEGPNHAPLGTRFLHPWNEDVAYSTSDETLTFGGEEGWDVNACPFETDSDADAEKVLALLTSEWKPAYDLVYYCSPYLCSLSEAGYDSIASLNADADFRNRMTIVHNRKNEVVTLYDDDYNLIYYRKKTSQYEVLTGHNVKDYVADYLDDLVAPTTEQLIAARKAKFKSEAQNYFNVGSATFHACYRFLLGATDNDAKNTYPFKLKSLSDGGRWEWRQDDLDTILATDNNGNSTKEYWVEPGDLNADGVDIFQGSSSVFWTLIESVFDVECRDMMMDKIIAAMNEVAEDHHVAGSFLWESIYNSFSFYFWDKSAKYFPATLYNEDAVFAYISVWQKDPNATYNNVAPLTQALGTQYEAEQQWVMRRIIYTFSKYQIGGFWGSSSDGLSSLEFTPAENFTFKVKPTIDMYPSGNLGGGNNIKGERTKAGEVCEIASTSDGSTTFYVKALDWLQSLGDLSGLKMTSRGGVTTIDFAVRSKRMKDLIVGNADASKVKFNATSLSVSGNAFETIDARNVKTLVGMVRLLDITRLKKALFEGSTASGILLPVGAKIQEVSMPSKMNTLFLHSLPILRRENLTIPEDAKKEIESIYYYECPNVSIFDIIRDAHNAEGSKLRYLSATWMTPQSCTSADLDMLEYLTTPFNEDTGEGYGRVIFNDETNTISVNADKPNLQGVINVIGAAYEDSVNAIRRYFPSLTLNIEKYFVRFKDQEVLKVLLANAQHEDEGGFTKEELGNITDIGTWFKDNTDIKSFDELDMTSVTKIENCNLEGCINLRLVNHSLTEGSVTAYTMRYWHLKTAVFYGLKEIGNLSNVKANPFKNTKTLFMAFPNLELYKFSQEEHEVVAIKVIDIGTKLRQFESNLDRWKNGNTGYDISYVIRAINSPVIKMASPLNGGNKIFVPASSLQDYITAFDSTSSFVFPIGGTKWIDTMHTLAEQYAAEYAGWSTEQIATADYSDPYIDYRIFGVEPPTE